MKRRHFIYVARWALTGMATLAFLQTARADEALDDLAGRVEYAFYAADSRSLSQSVQALDKLEVVGAELEQRNTYLNYGRWKLAQLTAQENSGQAHTQAQQAAQECADAGSTTKNTQLQAINKALAAACLGLLEELRPVRSVWYRHEREAALTQAQHLAGKLVQVRFVAAWLSATKDSGAQSYELLKQLVAQYAAGEGESQSASSWGYAEACYMLGKAELARSHALAARNALEQALVLAPDYRDAQKLLQTLTLK